MDNLEKVLEEEIKNERVENTANIIYTLLVFISLAFILRGTYLLTDKTIFSFKCSHSSEMGATVKLKPISRFSRKEAANEIYAFARSYVLCAFPRNIGSAKSCYEYVARHTKKRSIKKRYEAFVDDFDVIKNRFERGMIDEFSPKSSNEYRIEKKDSGNVWVFEIDGILNKRKSLLEEDRGVVTLRLTISYSNAEEEGSYTGLYIEDFEILHLKNIITGEYRDVLEE
jgi:hypothetical protein